MLSATWKLVRLGDGLSLKVGTVRGLFYATVSRVLIRGVSINNLKTTSTKKTKKTGWREKINEGSLFRSTFPRVEQL